jgi:hypothetical protein
MAEAVGRIPRSAPNTRPQHLTAIRAEGVEVLQPTELPKAEPPESETGGS